MKRLVIRLLGMLGLVTSGRHRALAVQLREAEVRAKKLTKLVDEIRAESREWKTKANDAAKKLKSGDKDATRSEQRVEKLRAEGERLRAEIHRIKAKDVELDALMTRLIDAERELTIAREQLMAVEVKLDILEGAANVLDERTRAVIAERVGERGTPV